MILSDRDIVKYKRLGEINIMPWDDALLQPASYDFTLGTKFRKINGDEFELAGSLGKYTLMPNEFILGCTEQKIKLGSRHAASMSNKSTNGRMGLMVTCEANWIDPGFEGVLTMELKNISPVPIKLLVGVKIAQVVFYELSSDCAHHYDGHYQGQRGPQPSVGFQI